MAEQEKGIGRKLLSFFIVDETEHTATTTTTTSNPATGQKTVQVQQTVSVQNAAGTGVIDKKFVDHFVEVIEKSNLKGPDYFEYMQSLKSMAGLGLSEDKLFMASWASFKAMGGLTDVTILTSTASQYLQMLATDREAFLKDVESAIAQRVGGLQNEQAQLQADNEAIAKQILDLQNKINANNERLAKIGGEIAEQSAKITTNKSNYEITYNSFVDQIKGDITKIGQYLK